MKAGDIIENYQGRFAKIVEVNGSLFGVSAFVMKRDQAEVETAVNVFLNKYGLAQILKVEEAKAPKAKAPKAE